MSLEAMERQQKELFGLVITKALELCRKLEGEEAVSAFRELETAVQAASIQTDMVRGAKLALEEVGSRRGGAKKKIR